MDLLEGQGARPPAQPGRGAPVGRALGTGTGPVRVAAGVVALLVLVAGALVSVAGAAAQSVDDERSQLEATRDRHDEAEYRLDQLERSDAELAASIEAATEALAAAAAELAVAEQRLNESYQVLQSAQADLVAARERVAAAEADFRRRAARAAAHPQLLPDAAIFTSEDPTLFAKREVMTRVVLEGDIDALEQLTAARRHHDAEVVRLDEAARAAARAAAEAEARHGDVAARQAELEAARDALQTRIAESQAEVEALARQEAELVAIIRQREAQARATAAAAGDGDRGGGGGGGGALRWPARGWVSSEFGPRWGRNHNGLDIAAPTGTAVVAAASGVVFHAGPFGSFGNLVAVDHGEGQTTFYAHLSTVEVGEGQWVQAGARIAGVGSTGRSTGPHLHFEVRLGGVPRNPRQFLG